MGTITQALRTAQSGLLVNQRVMETIAQNVSNVNTENYSRKIVQLQNQSLNGTGAGVIISGITRRVDEGLLKSLRLETSELYKYQAQEDYYARLQDLFGAPGENTSIAHAIDELTQAFEALALTPERSLEQSEVVRQAENITIMFQNLSNSIQDLRLQADKELGELAQQLNTLTGQIDQLNDDIIANGSVGRDTTDLRDQRDAKLTELAELTDIRYFYRDDGDVVVFTSDGRTLVDTVPPTITHTPAAAVASTTTHAEGDFTGFYFGSTDVEANDNTTGFRQGKIAGLIEMRDEILPNLQSQMDELAASMRDVLNQVHNQGASFPGAQEYNGTRIFTEPSNQTIKLDPTNSSDDVAIILFDASGNQSKDTTLNTIMTDAGFSSRGSGDDWNIDDVASTLQAWLRNNGAANASVSVNSNGKFDIAVNNTSLNLAFRDQASSTRGADAESATIAYDANGDGFTDETVSGFSYFFGLNDFYVDNLADNIWESGVQASSYATSGGTLTFRDTANGLIGTLSVTSSSSLEDIADAINLDSTLSQYFTAAVVPDGSGERLRISHNDGSSFTLTDGNNETVLSGMGMKVADVRVSSVLQVRSDISATPGLMATGAPQWNPDLGGSGEYYMSAADDTVISGLAEAMNSTRTYTTAGGLSATTSSFTTRAAAIVSTSATLAADNAADIKSQLALQQSLEFKHTADTGVNLDEELANLIIFEQAFSASARVISTINDMFDSLERIL